MLAGDSSVSLLSTGSCQQMHEPANPQVSPYGYAWSCYSSTDAGGLIFCTHNVSNTINYYNVTLAFDMDRAFVGFTNGMRPKCEDDMHKWYMKPCRSLCWVTTMSAMHAYLRTIYPYLDEDPPSTLPPSDPTTNTNLLLFDLSFLNSSTP